MTPSTANSDHRVVSSGLLRWVLCGVVLVTSGCSLSHSPAAMGDDPVLAVVGSRTIYRSDLERRILDRYYGKRALLGVVREALFELEAKRLGVSVSRAEVEAAVARELESADAQLDERLAQVGLDRADVADELRAELRTVLLLDKVVRPQRRIGEHEIQRRYERTYGKDRVAVRHIALPFGVAGTPSAERVAEVRREAESVLARVREGAASGNPEEVFAGIAREVSQHPQTAPRGGAMGVISRETAIDEGLREAIFRLEVGELSDPIREGEYGFHIFRVDRRIPARPLAEVREELRRQLMMVAPTEAEISAVEQLLRSRTSVTVYDDALSRP